MTLPLARADRIAASIVAELAKYCDQIDIAGSIRRRRPFVNDIDIVVLPKHGEYLTLRERVRSAGFTVKDGDQELVVRLKTGVQLDLWIARQPGSDMFVNQPTNYGSLLLCRTGSAAHNIFLIEHAKRMGLRWHPHQGLFCGASQLMASATEQAIFEALALDFVPPEKRER
jgi:DNA polymerase (family 10)